MLASIKDFMSTVAVFDGLRLRHADSVADLQQLSDWIEVDEEHRGVFSPHYFLTGKLGMDYRPSCYALEDSQGLVFYIRLSRASRVRIQFGPEGDRRQKARVARSLLQGMAFLESQLANAGAEEWIFDTRAPRLTRLAEMALGFKASPHEMVRAIAAPKREGGG